MKLNPDGAVIKDTARVNNSKFGIYTLVDDRARVTDSFMDDYSYILRDSEMIYTSIGKFCAIAPFVRINPGTHPFWRPAMANFVYRSKDYGFDSNDQDFFDYRKSQKVVIGHDVWIGQNALIMPGVTVGTGSVIGGGAIVTKDVPPYTIACGNPAKKIRDRFPTYITESLLRIEWWNWSRSQLELRLNDLRLSDMTVFCKKYDDYF